MENNIFVKMNKTKFNPDIEQKLKTKELERDSVKFELNNSIYNPITGIIPNKISSVKDLVLEKDMMIDKVNIQKLISDKNTERINQDNMHKPIKTKVINNISVQQTNETKETKETKETNNISKISNDNKIDYIKTFEDMKKNSYGSNKKLEQSQSQSQSNYNSILDGLKDLGIIK
jgi:hypothetical protein